MDLRRSRTSGPSRTPVFAFALYASVACISTAPAADWPHWRGPTGNGAAVDADPPVGWAAEKGPAWKTSLPGEGTASPIVWGDKIFISTAIKDDGDGKDNAPSGSRGGLARHHFVLLAIDRATGKILWKETAVTARPEEGHHEDHGFASASPCADEERVYAHFGSRGIFAYTHEGKLAWKRTDLGSMRTRNGFGEGSSPTLHGDSLIIPWDQEGPSYITALDRRTGATLWKTSREEPSSWGTPIVVEHAMGAQVITTGERFVRSYDLKSGAELWRAAGQTARPVASPVAGHGLVIVGSGFRGAYLGAFRLDRRGNLAVTGGVAWSVDKHTPDIPSPLLSGKRVYFLAGRAGILSCHDVETGKAHYSAERVAGLANIYASPVAAAGRVYLTGRDGTVVAVEDGEALKVLATSSVGEPVDATPAVAGKDLIIRGKHSLFCYRA